jgi:hypothetical protein
MLVGSASIKLGWNILRKILGSIDRHPFIKEFLYFLQIFISTPILVLSTTVKESPLVHHFLQVFKKFLIFIDYLTVVSSCSFHRLRQLYPKILLKILPHKYFF